MLRRLFKVTFKAQINFNLANRKIYAPTMLAYLLWRLLGEQPKRKKRKKSKRIVCTDILQTETTQRKRICMQYVEKQRKIDRKNMYICSIYSGSSLSIQFQLYLQTYSSITHRFWKETVQFKTMLKFLHIYSTQYIYIFICTRHELFPQLLFIVLGAMRAIVTFVAVAFVVRRVL